MNVFDMYLMGDVDSINWGFSSQHLEQRLKENGIKLDYIQDLVFYEEPLDHSRISDDRFEVFFEAPQDKSYGQLRLIFACGRDSIDVITVIPTTIGCTNRYKSKFETVDYKKMKKMLAKAHA